MTHAQKPDFVLNRKGRIHLNRRGRQFSRLLAAEVYASALVMLNTPCSEVLWMVLATHSIRQFPLHFPSRASPCAIRFQTHSTDFSNRPCSGYKGLATRETIRGPSTDRSKRYFSLPELSNRLWGPSSLPPFDACRKLFSFR